MKFLLAASTSGSIFPLKQRRPGIAGSRTDGGMQGLSRRLRKSATLWGSGPALEVQFFQTPGRLFVFGQGNKDAAREKSGSDVRRMQDCPI